MSEEQITKLRDILVNEKVQLEKLDAEYQAEMSKLNQKNESSNFSEDELKKRYQEIAEAEQQAEAEEQSEEEKLLSQLDNL